MLEYTPMEYRCVVRLDAINNTYVEGGLIEYIDSEKNQEQMHQIYGTLVDKTDMAFTDADNKRWKCEVPKVGDRVMIAKYSGFRHEETEDGKKVIYCYLNDKDIIAFKKGEADG